MVSQVTIRSAVIVLLTLGSAEALHLPVRDSITLWKRQSNPFTIQVFSKNSKPDGDVVESSDSFDLGGPITLTSDASCGTITGTQISKNNVACNFQFPATLPAGTSKFTDNGNHFTVSISDTCAGVLVDLDNTCSDCGDVGEVFNKETCNKKDNDINICNNNGKLEQC